MNVNDDLLGKTITGVIAHRNKDTGLREIWVLQFADGSHVEFVSPGGRKVLRQAANQEPMPNPRLARQTLRNATSQANKLTDSRSLRYQRSMDNGIQLTLNVA
jgi:hypothetical protein